MFPYLWGMIWFPLFIKFSLGLGLFLVIYVYLHPNPQYLSWWICVGFQWCWRFIFAVVNITFSLFYILSSFIFHWSQRVNFWINLKCYLPFGCTKLCHIYVLPFCLWNYLRRVEHFRGSNSMQLRHMFFGLDQFLWFCWPPFLSFFKQWLDSFHYHDHCCISQLECWFYLVS